MVVQSRRRCQARRLGLVIRLNIVYNAYSFADASAFAGWLTGWLAAHETPTNTLAENAATAADAHHHVCTKSYICT